MVLSCKYKLEYNVKKKIIDIPEVQLSDVKEFWVLGSQYKDGILGEYNLKIDVKAAVSGEGQDDSDDEDIFIDISNLEYPAAVGEGVSETRELPESFAEKLGSLHIGETVNVKEPSGVVEYHVMDVDPNGYGVILHRSISESGAGSTWYSIDIDIVSGLYIEWIFESSGK